MDIISIVSIAIVIIVIYYLIRLMPSLVHAVTSIIALFVILYLLKVFFHVGWFDVLMGYVNPANWKGIMGYINYWIGQIGSFIHYILGNAPK